MINAPLDQWTLLYKSTEDGFGAYDFHAKFDGYANTLTVIRPDGSSNIFGGFTRVNWDTDIHHKEDEHAFIFSLVNRVKMKVSESKCSIYCGSSYGPTFGDNITIKDNSNSNTDLRSSRV